MKNAKSRKAAAGGNHAELLATLRARFEKHPARHANLSWAQAAERLERHPGKLDTLEKMERTGGEPDVVGRDPETGEVVFVDCSPQSPAGRTSLCYDREALESRREHAPKNSVMDLAAAMGVEVLTEEQYHELQRIGEFDTKSSSWLKTPGDLRKLGGALFGDRRYNRVFIYHNGAQSYYSGRGFRGRLCV